jgi:5'(3')-deoxyribonucleotidase
MNYKIIDNVLDDDEFHIIQKTLLGADFPWYLNNSKVFANSTVPELYNFQFTHTFYDQYKVQSNYIYLLDRLLSYINPSAIVRIKANLQPVTENIIVYDMHNDLENFDGETAVFYVNSNNGYTVLENNQQISSQANRLLQFSSDLKHAGTSCTDQKVRCVINLNYYNWKKSQ